jgi:hypothetical protein
MLVASAEGWAAAGTFVAAAISAVSAYFAMTAARATREAAREAKRTADGQVFMALEARLQEPVMRHYRGEVAGAPPFETWDDELVIKAELVAQSFQTAGHLCRHGVVDPVLIVENWGNIASRCWPKVRPWVEYRRSEEGFPELYDDFEWLAAQWSQHGSSVARS